MKNRKEHTMTIHHCPPRSQGRTRFLLQKLDYKHQAYHLIFSNSPSFEACCHILWEEWWRPENSDEPMPNVKGDVHK